MEMFLKFFYSFIVDKTVGNIGWRKYIIFPFILLWYKLKLDIMLYRYIERPNTTLDFRSLILEYTLFLDILGKTIYIDKDINDIIRYNDTTKIFIVYDSNDMIKSVSYIFKGNNSTSIKVTVHEPTKSNTIEILSSSGNTTFSFSSVVDSKLECIKNNVELIIRRDISANIRYLLLENEY